MASHLTAQLLRKKRYRQVPDWQRLGGPQAGVEF
jgi:hypothetical protein